LEGRLCDGFGRMSKCSVIHGKPTGKTREKKGMASQEIVEV
jgi:hypothetical protein